MKKLLIIVVVIFFGSCKKLSKSSFEIGRVRIGTAYDVTLKGNYAYVGINKGVAVINISNPENPKKVETLKTNEAVESFFIDGNIMFVGSGGTQNLRAYDITNPGEPLFLSSITITDGIVAISKNGNHLFIATIGGYLMIVDVTDLVNMNLVKSFNCNGQGSDLVCNQGFVYYANAKKGLQIIDVNNLENPIITATINGTLGAWDVFIQDNYLYLAKHHYGFSILSLTDPALPQRLFNNDNGGEPYGICSNNTYLCVADLQQGIEIWDNSDKENPVLLLTLDEYVSHDLVVRDDLIFLADQDRGFVIIRY